MQRRILSFGLAFLPALIAGIAVSLEPTVTAWVKGRESALLLAVFVLLAAMLHARIRQILVTTLCYGVAFLALRDMRQMPRLVLPPDFDYLYIEQGRMIALFLVAILAAIAGLVETLNPGTTLARRLYFGASALYFTGLGILNLAWHGSWQSLLLCITGGIAFFGCLFAHRIVAEEAEEETVEAPDDDTFQRERNAAHLQALYAKEWRDTAGDSRDLSRPSSGPTPTISPQ